MPHRKFCHGKKKLAAWRLHETLLNQLEKVAEKRGWNTTDIVATALDQFCQWDEIQKKTPPGYKKK